MMWLRSVFDSMGFIWFTFFVFFFVSSFFLSFGEIAQRRDG